MLRRATPERLGYRSRIHADELQGLITVVMPEPVIDQLKFVDKEGAHTFGFSIGDADHKAIHNRHERPPVQT